MARGLNQKGATNPSVALKNSVELASLASVICGSSYFALVRKDRDLEGNGHAKILDFYNREALWTVLSDIIEPSDNKGQNHFLSIPNPPFPFFKAFPVKDLDGNVICFLAVYDEKEILLDGQQIDAVKVLCNQISRLLEEESCTDLQNYSELFELSEDLICICSSESVLESVNPSFQRILGWVDEQVIGKSLFDFVEEKDRRNTRAKLGRLISRSGSVSFTHRLLTSKNDYRTVEWVATVVPTTGKVSAIGRDITDEIEKQQKLAISEKKFKVFFENSQGLMCIHDLFGKFISVNESGAHILGYTKEELDGKGLYDIVPKTRHRYLDEYLKAIAKLGHVKGQMITCAKDGTERMWMFSNVLQKDDQGAVNVIGNAVDITERHALESDLLHTKSILEQTNKVARVGGWELDVINQTLEWTSVTKEIHGVEETYVPDLSTVLNFSKPGESRDKMEEAFQNIVANGGSYDLEIEIINASGQDLWVRAIGNAVFSDGICTSVFGTLQDIDKTKRSEIALGASKKLLDDVLDAAADLCIIATDNNGLITVFNKGAEDLLGYSANEMLGTQMPEFFEYNAETDSNKTNSKTAANEVKDLRYFFSMRGADRASLHELVYIAKEGERFDVSLSVSAITDPKGEPLGHLGVATDITRQKQMEVELATERARLLAFIEHTPAAVAMLDNDMRYLAVSRKWIEDYNFRNQDIIGASHYTMFPNLDEERKLRHREILKGQVLRREEDVFIDSLTDEQHFITLEMRPWYKSASEIGGMMIFTQDISGMVAQRDELKAAKIHADEANLAKSEFLANMSHEIRTPLNGVIGFTDLLLKTTLNETQQQYLKIVSQSAGALLNIINDILDFSKIEAGKFELDIEKCDLFEMTCQATDITTYQIQSKNLEMLLNLSPELPRFVWTDDVRLKQVLINLLGNASKFTEQGEIELKVQMLENFDDKCLFRFSIRDTGIGIQQDKQEKIFDAFAQEDSSTTKKYGGTGLGLTISNKLLRMMGSKLQLTSTPGVGSTFYFDILLACEQGEAVNWEAIDSINNILIVDDNDNNRHILADMLELKQIKADLAKSGFEALQNLAEGKRYDAVLMDYHMPFMDGLETTTKIRQTFFSSHAALPILLLHSSADDSTLISASRTLQVSHRLVKPIKMPDLYNALSRLHVLEEEPAVEDHKPKAESNLDHHVDFTILIVEDNEVNRFLARTLIGKLYPGAKVVEAKNGQEGVEQFILTSPKLILMDVQMPVMNGYQATKAIRLAETTGRTPIIAVTAGNVSGEREKCIEAGMDDFITKPILEGSLELILGSWVEGLSVGMEDQDFYTSSPTEHFDPGKLKMYYGENRDKLARIASLTISQLKQSVADLDAYLTGGELENIRLLGHKVYGTSVSAGLVYLAEISTKLERLESLDEGLCSELQQEFLGEITLLIEILTSRYLN